MKTIKFISPVKVVVALAVAFSIFVGCKKEKSNGNNVLNTVSAEDVDYSDITDDLVFISDVSSCSDSKGPVKIIQIDLWRKQFDCRKLGICEIIVLGDTIYQSMSCEEPSREIVVAIEIENKNPILTLVLANPIPERVCPQDLLLYVDEDIYGYEENTDNYVVFPQGVYEYDPNIGMYGGYNVYYSTGRLNGSK